LEKSLQITYRMAGEQPGSQRRTSWFWLRCNVARLGRSPGRRKRVTIAWACTYGPTTSLSWISTRLGRFVRVGIARIPAHPRLPHIGGSILMRRAISGDGIAARFHLVAPISIGCGSRCAPSARWPTRSSTSWSWCVDRW